MSVYLDYNSTTPIDDRVLDVMIDIYKNHIGNADSRTHLHGENTRIIVEDSRKKVASLLNVKSDEVFFTSGATESNNIAIQGLKQYAIQNNKKHIITTSIEHKSVLETIKEMERQGFAVDYINPDVNGRININEIKNKLRDETFLVSIMHVNNETGIIQPVQEIGEFLKDKDVFFHVDATQSCGKLVNEIKNINYSMLSFSAHKLCGPQGVGCLILKKKRYKLPPVKNILYGGQQEHGIRPGTIPVALVAGCGKACEIAEEEYLEHEVLLREIKNEFLGILDDSEVPYHFNGNPEYCMNNTMNICFEGVMSEALMISTKQYCGISNGSACTSKSYSPSYVLTNMGIPKEKVECSVRISWGYNTNKREAVSNFKNLIEVVKSLAL